jgi:RimK family alpha-L-glutamate ligase
MRFCLVSGKQGEDVKQIILEEAQKLFDTVLYVPIKKIRIECFNGKTRVFFRNTDISKFDVVFVRPFGEDFVLAEILLDALENLGVLIFGSSEAYQICNHKYYTVKTVAKIGVPLPDSSMTITPQVALMLARKIGFPAVVKLISGFGGKGVMLLNTETEFTPILDTLKVFKEFISTQEFIPSSGIDYRALVIGKTVLGIKRTGAEGDFRANVSAGGKAEFVELDEDLKEMALKSAELLGLEICAVDFLMTKEGPKLVEINFTPGMIKDFFGNQIAAKIIKYIFERTKEVKEEKSKNEKGFK